MNGSGFYSHGWPDSSAECPIVSYRPWNAGYLPSFSVSSVTQKQKQCQEPSRGI